MSMDIYTPNDTDVIHSTKADFRKRTIQETVHLVQYEKNLPVIAVALMYNGYSYTAPATSEVWIRWGKKDHTYVYKKCMVSADRKTVYFDVDYQMTYYYGELNPILELIIGGKSAGSSPLPIMIDRNPIQESDQESEIHDDVVAELRQDIYELNRDKQDKLTFDDTPTAGSNNPVKSGGIKQAIDDAQIHGIYRYKGTVATVGDLPSSGNQPGDSYDVQADGKTYVWNGSSWDQKTAAMEPQLDLEETPRGYSHATDHVDERELEVAKALSADEAEEAKLAEDLKTDREIDNPELSCPPIVFGTVGGDAEVATKDNPFEYMEGRSEKFHQLLDPYYPQTNSYGCNVDFQDGYFIISGTGINNGPYLNRSRGLNPSDGDLAKGFKIISGHKYLIYTDLQNTDNYGLRIQVKKYNPDQYSSFQPNTISYIVSDGDWYGCVWFFAANGYNIPNLKFKVMVFDLTSLDIDVNTVDEAIAALKEKNIDVEHNYYPYNPGTILSSKSASLISRGENQWDEEYESGIYDVNGQKANNSLYFRNKNPIPVLSNTEYFYSVDGNQADDTVFFYDAAMNFISLTTEQIANTAFTIPEGCKFINFCRRDSVYQNNVSIYICYDTPGRPYVKAHHQTVTLPNIELRSIPGTDIKDIAYQIGGGKRRVLKLDMGSLNWDYNSSWRAFSTNIPLAARKASPGAMCSSPRFKMTENAHYSGDQEADLTMCINAHAHDPGISTFRDLSFNGDVAAFKAAMSGVPLLVELASEQDITEEENPGWDELVFTDNWGTLEFTTDPQQTPQVPQPYFIRYTVSLGEFLDSAYEHAEGNAENLARVPDLKDGSLKVKDAEHADSAKSLDTELGNDDETPFSYQTAGGESDIETGMQELRKLVGVDVVKNNPVHNCNFNDGEGWWAPYSDSGTYSSLSISNHKATITVDVEGKSIWQYSLMQQSINFIQGHKYLIMCNIESSDFTTFRIEPAGANSHDTDFGSYAMVHTIETRYNGNLLIFPTSNTPLHGMTFTVSRVLVCDLTQRYGNNDVVNAIIGSDASKQVERLLAFDPGILDDTDYDEGTLVPSKSAKLKMVDYNLFDEDMENGNINSDTGLPVNDGADWCLRSKNFSSITGNKIGALYNRRGDWGYDHFVYFYDANKQLIQVLQRYRSLSTFDIPQNARFFKILIYTTNYGYTDYQNDICLFIQWDGSRIGYEPHDEHVYPLPNKELHGILKVINGKVVADGDELYPDGSGKKRYKKIIKNTIDSGYADTYAYRGQFAISDIIPSSNVWEECNSTILVVAGWNKDTNVVGAMQSFNPSVPSLSRYYYGDKNIYLCAPGCTTKAQLDAYLLEHPIELIYEVDSEHEEDLTNQGSFPEQIYVDDFGTMEFLDEDDNPISGLQGCEIFYKANVAGFAESLYQKTGGDPDELVTQEDLEPYKTVEELSSQFVNLEMCLLSDNESGAKYFISFSIVTDHPNFVDSDGKTAFENFLTWLYTQGGRWNSAKVPCSGIIRKANGIVLQPVEIQVIGGTPIGYSIRCIKSDGSYRENLTRSDITISATLEQYRLPIGKDS